MRFSITTSLLVAAISAKELASPWTSETWEVFDGVEETWTHWWVKHDEGNFSYYEKFLIKLTDGSTWSEGSIFEWYWCDFKWPMPDGNLPCNLYSA